MSTNPVSIPKIRDIISDSWDVKTTQTKFSSSFDFLHAVMDPWFAILSPDCVSIFQQNAVVSMCVDSAGLIYRERINRCRSTFSRTDIKIYDDRLICLGNERG